MSESRLKVKLIAHSPEPDKLVTMAAKLCYSPVGVEEIGENLTEEQVDKFLGILVDMGHESPLEHASFSFAIEGISRACSHQLVRHRMASYSQQSQRYVRLEQMDYIIPPSIAGDLETKAQYIRIMDETQKAYTSLVENLIKKGRTEKEAIEDARYVFPNACETKILVTMNARSLLNFFEMRTCLRAQWEIQELAYRMLEECKKVAPILFKKAGPSCYTSTCKEGKMSCGKPNIPRERILGMEQEK